MNGVLQYSQNKLNLIIYLFKLYVNKQNKHILIIFVIYAYL